MQKAIPADFPEDVLQFGGEAYLTGGDPFFGSGGAGGGGGVTSNELASLGLVMEQRETKRGKKQRVVEDYDYSKHLRSVEGVRICCSVFFCIVLLALWHSLKYARTCLCFVARFDLNLMFFARSGEWWKTKITTTQLS